MSVFTYIFCACFLALFAYWRVTAIKVKPAAEQAGRIRSVAFRLPQIVGLAMLVWWWQWPAWFSAQVTPSREAAGLAGCVLCLAGLALAIWSRRTLADNWSSEVMFKADHELVTKGPYRHMRHPIYTSFILMLLGPVIASGRVHAWLGLAIMCVGWWIKLRQEEQMLVRHFADEYRNYQRRVKALVPYLI